MRLQFTQLLPPTSGIKDTATKGWADKITHFLDETFRKVANIPFNRSEEISIADTGTADTTVTLSHHLGRVPSGFIVSFIDKAAVVYCDSTDFGSWSKTEIKLKCNVANTKAILCLY